MQQQEFQNMIKNDEYHFFVFACPACLLILLSTPGLLWLITVR